MLVVKIDKVPLMKPWQGGHELRPHRTEDPSLQHHGRTWRRDPLRGKAKAHQGVNNLKPIGCLLKRTHLKQNTKRIKEKGVFKWRCEWIHGVPKTELTDGSQWGGDSRQSGSKARNCTCFKEGQSPGGQAIKTTSSKEKCNGKIITSSKMLLSMARNYYSYLHIHILAEPDCCDVLAL